MVKPLYVPLPKTFTLLMNPCFSSTADPIEGLSGPVLCVSTQEPLLGLFKVYITQASEKDWVMVDLIDVRAKRIIGEPLVLHGNVRSVHLLSTHGYVSFLGDPGQVFGVADFIRPWSTSTSKYAQYMVELLSTYALSIELKKLVDKVAVSECNVPRVVAIRAMISECEDKVGRLVGEHPLG